MATTLTYGRVRPADGDTGATFWDNLKDNITLDDAHDHDGTDSAVLYTKGITPGTSTVTNSGWTADGTWYYKTITMPSGWTWGNCQMSFFLNATNAQIFPKLVYVGSTQYKLYMPVSDAAVDVLYT